MNSLLGFLNSSKIEEVVAPARKGGVRKEWNPAPSIVAVRLWKNGSIFPSQAAVDKFDLAYKNATVKKEPIKLKEGEVADPEKPKFKNTYSFPDGSGYGFDLLDSRSWNEVKAGEGAMLFVAAVPKSEGKVDLFNTVAYDDAGVPKVTVMEQGALTFGQQVLLPAVEAVYGVNFNRDEVKDEAGRVAAAAITDGVDFVDLAIFDKLGDFDITAKYSKPIIFAPKLVSRGADKGKADYARRENVKVYGLAPAELVIEGYVKPSGEAVAES